MIDKTELEKLAAEARMVKKQLDKDRENYKDLLRQREDIDNRIRLAESSNFNINPYYGIEQKIIESVLGPDFYKEQGNES